MPGHLAILDVGHGNAAILKTDDWVAIIDAGPGSSLVQYLIEQGITRIDEVLISHADEDHLAGLVGVLSSGQFSLGRVRLNSDAVKDSKIWMDLAVALDDAARKGAIDFRPSLTASDSGQFDHGAVSIEILAPTNFLATRGPGSTDRGGKRITTNSISAVIRIAVNGQRLVLLAGDVDEIGLDELDHVGTADLGAPILVFPHHGGRAGAGDPGAFATRLSQMVQPTCVIFSIGRGIHGTPIPSVVDAIRRHGAQIRVACTQLSEHCAAMTPNSDPAHLNTVFARGRERHQCCAGTLIVDFQRLGTLLPDATTHLAFIQANAPTSLCQR
jgi:competence protein ComEC